MLVCKINPLKPEKDIISKAIKILKQGGIVVYPTETAYGLAADFLNSQAVKKIFQIKHRPKNKKLTLIASDFKMVKKYFELNQSEKELIKTYWPGPLTLILRVRGKIGRKEAGVRISSNPIALKFCQKLGRPITATSANLSGRPACYSAQDVIRQLAKQKHLPDLILDAGKLPGKRVSTIAKIEKNKIKVIRQGKIKLAQSKF